MSLEAGGFGAASGWLDVHAHFAPSVIPPAAMRSRDFLLAEPFRWSADGALRHMDRTGVAMQLLSQVPNVHDTADPAGVHRTVAASNRYGAGLVAAHPDRFGLLAAVPTDDTGAALSEIAHAVELGADGVLLAAPYAGVHLGDPRLEPVWADIERRGLVALVHPDANAPGAQGRPSPLIEVAFSTARSVVDMLYAGVLRRHPGLTVILAHAGGALPALSGRLGLLGDASWVPNPQRVTSAEMREQLARLYLDVAASGASIGPAVAMAGAGRLVYGSDSGAPCTEDAGVAANIEALAGSGLLEALGPRGFDLFPAAARRAGLGS